MYTINSLMLHILQGSSKKSGVSPNKKVQLFKWTLNQHQNWPIRSRQSIVALYQGSPNYSRQTGSGPEKPVIWPAVHPWQWQRRQQSHGGVLEPSGSCCHHFHAAPPPVPAGPLHGWAGRSLIQALGWCLGLHVGSWIRAGPG